MCVCVQCVCVCVRENFSSCVVSVSHFSAGLKGVCKVESVALASCLSCQTWVAAALQIPPVTEALWHTSCKSILLAF